MFGRSGVPRLKCRLGGLHEARSTRLTVTTARLTDWLATSALMDDEARHWQGGTPERLTPDAALLAADPVVWHKDFTVFVGRDRRTGTLVSSISLYRIDGRYHIGGTVGADYRKQGIGREALEPVCSFAHRHVGIGVLTAGCEATNVASRRWLASCGFAIVEASGTHVLPNGRVIESCSWLRADVSARRRCWVGGRPWTGDGSDTAVAHCPGWSCFEGSVPAWSAVR